MSTPYMPLENYDDETHVYAEDIAKKLNDGLDYGYDVFTKDDVLMAYHLHHGDPDKVQVTGATKKIAIRYKDPGTHGWPRIEAFVVIPSGASKLGFGYLHIGQVALGKKLMYQHDNGHGSKDTLEIIENEKAARRVKNPEHKDVLDI